MHLFGKNSGAAAVVIPDVKKPEILLQMDEETEEQGVSLPSTYHQARRPWILNKRH